jgi:hypothetical protein
MLQISARRDHGINPVTGTLTRPFSPHELRQWLAGRWALLFSHPDDFADYGFETDRWLVYLRNAFDSLRLRPLAIGHDDASGWVSQAGGRFIPGYEAAEFLPPLSSCTQPRKGQGMADHFVTILDGGARARRTILYSPAGEIPSLIELAHTATRVREQLLPASIRRILESI